MSNYLLILALCLTAGCTPMYGQSELTLESLLKDSTNLSNELQYLQFVAKSQVNGSEKHGVPLASNDWETGYLVDLEDRVFHLKGKLNWKDHQLSILAGEEIMDVYLEGIKGWKSGSDWWVPAEYVEKGRDPLVGIFQILVDGRVNLLKRPLLVGNKYYLQQTDRSVVRIGKGRYAVLKKLPAKRDEVRGFIKKEKLNLLKEEDLKLTLVYYNSLY